MKAIALLLCFYILFLTALPSIAVALKNSRPGCHQKTFCKKCKISQPYKEKKKDCTKGNCTPFFGCNKLQEIVVQQTEKAPSASVITILNFSIYKESITTDYYSEFWHPPRLSY